MSAPGMSGRYAADAAGEDGGNNGGNNGGWRRAARLLPRDKADTLLLLLSSLMVLAPHAAHLPLWTSFTAAATLLWRTLITLRGTRLPPLWLLLPIALLAMAGVYGSFHTLLGRDSGVAMLALLLAFKLLEMHAKRDLFVVVFLSFFLMLANFFYSQSIATALLMIATIIVLLTAQLSFQYTGLVPPLARRLRLTAGIFALAAPLALLLFVIVPRVQGPLWGLPGDAHGGRTGMSDKMTPGGLSSLADSNEAAFSVRFAGPLPARRELYWRGVVLSDYDGRTWSRFNPFRYAARRGAALPAVEASLRGPATDYEVTLEPQGKRWMYVLGLPQSIDGVPGNPPAPTPEMEFFARDPINERIRYKVRSMLSFSLQAEAQADQLQPWLALPAGYNPRTLAWARELMVAGDPAASVRRVLKLFHDEQFRYTMQPPLLGRDAVDDFLFNSRAGFCEHYSGAFVVLMRAMHIPARVVMGYQGGELNPVDGYLTVRQSDAHAWAEVWLAGQGWTRFDPTAAVAPERIEKNLASALPPSAPFGMEALGGLMQLGGDGASWLSGLRFRMAALNTAWNQWVLDYNPDRQRSVTQNLAQTLTQLLASWRVLPALLAAAALLWWLKRLRLRRNTDPLEQLYAVFCRQQARRGPARAPDEGPQRYAARLRALPLAPEKQQAIARFLAIYAAIKYGVSTPAQKHAALKKLKSLLTESR